METATIIAIAAIIMAIPSTLTAIKESMNKLIGDKVTRVKLKNGKGYRVANPRDGDTLCDSIVHKNGKIYIKLNGITLIYPDSEINEMEENHLTTRVVKILEEWDKKSELELEFGCKLGPQACGGRSEYEQKHVNEIGQLWLNGVF